MATFKGNEFFCYDLSHNPIQSSTDEITLAFRTLQRNGLMLHTGKSADYVNLSLKSGAVWLVINLGSGAFEALVEPVNGKFNDNAWHDVRVTRNLRQVGEWGGLEEGQWAEVACCVEGEGSGWIRRRGVDKNRTGRLELLQCGDNGLAGCRHPWGQTPWGQTPREEGTELRLVGTADASRWGLRNHAV